MTDIDKLHSSILNWDYTYSHRRTGKTRILLHQIIGEIQVGNTDTILVLIKFQRNIPSLKREFRDCLYGQGITIIAESQNEIKLFNEDGIRKRLKFIQKDNEMDRIGYKNAAEYELDWIND